MPWRFRASGCASPKRGSSVGNFSRLDLLQARVDFNADSSKYMSQQELVTASRIRINELLANEDVNEMLCIRDSVIEVNGDARMGGAAGADALQRMPRC